MRFEVDTTLPAWGLWAPGVGWVINSLQYGRDKAAERLADRKADGAAFPGERVRQLRARLAVEMAEGRIDGYLVPVAGLTGWACTYCHTGNGAADRHCVNCGRRAFGREQQ